MTAGAGQRPADLVHDGPVSAALRAAAAEELELFASLRPQIYGQDLARVWRSARSRQARVAAARGGTASFGAAWERSAGPVEWVRPARPHPGKRAAGHLCQRSRQNGRSTAADIDSGRSGVGRRPAPRSAKLFQYVIISRPSRCRASNRPCCRSSTTVKGEKVSIYNQACRPSIRSTGCKLTNTTDLHLMQGPITVFDGGAYAGDAKIEDLPPERRAADQLRLDLDTEVAPRRPRRRPSNWSA